MSGQDARALAPRLGGTPDPGGRLPRTIVAEVSKTWRDGWHTSPDERVLSEKFEAAIAANAARGYRLASWQLAQFYVPAGPTDGVAGDQGHDQLTETIIAVFERED